ncbi:MAG: hypothetical protein JO060_10345 [Candidatus Eremiobacteraeota bacterium]|nr:hypothetical protein [Candidatus Eremiobacteraeota bacterium]
MATTMFPADAFVRFLRAPTWKKVAVMNPPAKRAGFALAYDEVSRKVVVFGGYGAHGYFNDTWTFDGTTWAKQAPSTAPSPRAGSNMIYDWKTKTLVLFGGYNGQQFLADTWLWDGATGQWTQAHPKSSPGGLTGPALFTDPLDRRADLFGGYDGQFYHLETWRWRGNTWQQLQTPVAPSARSFMVCATNLRARWTVVFGGLADVNPDNTWMWDGTQWTAENPPSQPPTVYDPASAYEPKLDAVLKFGGGNGGVDLADTWAWNGTTWTQLVPSKSPSARESARMAYDTALGRIVLFGDTLYSRGLLYNDTWELIP